MNRRLPSAYRIAIIGFPQSGKSFLITAIFNDLFAGKIPAYKIVPRGSEAIERINNNIERLETSKAIGPTKDQEVFAYRTDLFRKSYLFQRKWKAELGDFPGEDSEKFFKEYEYWLHKTPYFNWAISSDAYIFVIDLADYFIADEPKEFIHRMSSSFRAAWQHLNNYYISGNQNLQRTPVSLVFTKSDLIIRYPDLIQDFIKSNLKDRKNFIELIKRTGINGFDRLDFCDDDNPQIEHQLFYDIEKEFSGIIEYFHIQTKKLRVQFVSAVTTTSEGSLGISSLLSHILPR